MPSAFIPAVRGYPALPRAGQLAHQRYVPPNPLVLGREPPKPPAPATDRDRPVSRRSKPSSRTAFIAERAEGAFGLLRYPLGGDRPSQTAHLALSAARVHGPGLELKHNKGGVSSPAPRAPGCAPHSLPPTLRMLGLSPRLSCSKGSR